jgi:hypothetical protein
MTSFNPVLAEERNINHGANGFYDLRLSREGEKALVLDVTLTMFFDFVPNEDDPKIVWTQAERDGFSTDWGQQIPGAWDQTNHTTYRGHTISLRFNCDIRTDARDTQWQARIFKMKATSDYRTSAVFRGGYRGDYDAEFDSNDDLTKPIGDKSQTAMIHEFGHMIGNPDEYKSSSSHYSDKMSIMHSGSAVRDRHLDHFVKWAKPHIDALLLEEPMSANKENSAQFLQGLLAAESVASEISAVEAWRDNLEPGNGIHFTIRRRDTQEPVSIDKVELEDFADLEIVFMSWSGEVGDATVWHPRSAQALEAIFVE